MERFERLVDWAKSEKPGLELFSVFENVEALRESLREPSSRVQMTGDQKTEFESVPS